MIISIDSIFITGENYCPQVLLEECKFVIKEKRLIIVLLLMLKFLLIKKNSDKEDSNEEDSDEEGSSKKIKYYLTHKE